MLARSRLAVARGLQNDTGPRAPRHGRVVDGRDADALHRAPPPETFAYIASLSGPIIPLLSGDRPLDQGFQDPFDAKTAHVKLVYFESPGTAHEWQTWRRDLNELTLVS